MRRAASLLVCLGPRLSRPYSKWDRWESRSRQVASSRFAGHCSRTSTYSHLEPRTELTMRALTIGALASAILAAAAPAQQQPVADSVRPHSASMMDGRLRTEIALVRGLFGSIHAPPADSFRVGDHEVVAGATNSGTIAVARGNLAIRGRVTGDAIALHGDVIVYPGGVVGGNATAIDGHV